MEMFNNDLIRQVQNDIIMNKVNEKKESVIGLVGVLLALFLAILLKDIQTGNLNWSGTTATGGIILGISLIIALVSRKVFRP
jgi:hypothetical protein